MQPETVRDVKEIEYFEGKQSSGEVLSDKTRVGPTSWGMLRRYGAMENNYKE